MTIMKGRKEQEKEKFKEKSAEEVMAFTQDFITQKHFEVFVPELLPIARMQCQLQWPLVENSHFKNNTSAVIAAIIPMNIKVFLFSCMANI